MILKMEFKSLRNSLLIWSGIAALTLILFMAIFPSMNGEAMKELIDTKLGAMPEALMQAVGLSDMPDLSDISEYFAYTFQYIMLAGGIYAALLGASTLIREETDGTIEYLYAQPVSRTGIVRGKLFASLGIFAFFYLSSVIVSSILFLVFKPEDAELVTIMTSLKTMYGGALFTGLIFLSIGFVLSTLLKTAKQAAPAAIGLVFGTYILGIFSKTVSGNVEFAKVFKYLSPLDYAMPLDILKHGYDPVRVLIGALIIAVCIPTAFLIYRRRDLKS